MAELLCTIVSPGLFTTIQDGGRPGFRNMGVPISGFMDRDSAHWANHLVSNNEDAALLEITQIGPKILFHDFGALALTGANLSPKLNGISVPLNETLYFAKGDELSFGRKTSGFRTYLAFSGELQAESILGSKSTHVGNRWGGLNGSRLAKGDQLFISKSDIKPSLISKSLGEPDIGPIRIIPSLEFHLLPSAARDALMSQSWTISPESNRNGIRLTGDTLEFNFKEMISGPTDVGVIQLPLSGLPIILMPDSASTGGYPRIGAVIQSDLPRLAQKAPGDIIYFQKTEI